MKTPMSAIAINLIDLLSGIYNCTYLLNCNNCHPINAYQATDA